MSTGLIFGGSGAGDEVAGTWSAVGDSATGSTIIIDSMDPAEFANYMVLDSGTLTGFDQESDQIFNVDASSASWTAVATPEPTSGLLLLIGMAGLALRRRRA